MTRLRCLALVPALAVAIAAPASANEMIIGFGVGGGYDTWARTVARHIGKHMPGQPSFIPKNMPGAGSVKAANYIYSVAPKDGTVIGLIARDAPLLPITGSQGARFDARKFAWVGSPTSETNICSAFKTAPVKSVQELMEKELIVGSTGVGTGTHTYPTVLRELLGMKFRLIGGYKSSVEVMLAMERSEVFGICESYDSVKNRHPQWLKDGTITVLFHAGAEPHPELKHTPFLFDLVKTEEQRQALRFVYAGQAIGRPFIGPPDMPAATVAMLQKAFDATMKDPVFLEEARKQKLDVDPVSGTKLQTMINDLYDTPKPLIEKIGAMLKAPAK